MKLILVLTIICVIAAFLLGLTYNLTADKIRYQEEMAEKRALESVISSAIDFKKISGRTMEYYNAYDSNGKVMGYAFIGEGKGYSSIIKIMIGVDTQNNVKAVGIISQQETPGLGAKISEQWFQEQFSKKPVDKIDTITGATISSRAVRDIVKTAVEKFKKEDSGIL